MRLSCPAGRVAMKKRRRLLWLIGVGGLTIYLVVLFRNPIASYVIQSDLPIPEPPRQSSGDKAASTRKIDVGEGAPDFTVTAEGDKLVRLSDFRGQWVVLVFSRAHW